MKRFVYNDSYTIGNKAYTVLASDMSDEKIKNVFMMCYHLNNRSQALMLLGLLDIKRAFTLNPEEVPTQEEVDGTFESGEGEVVDVLDEEEVEDIVPTIEYQNFVDTGKVSMDRLQDMAESHTQQSARLQEYTARKQQLDDEKSNILSQYDAFEAETGE
jgi:hypothetical protein